MYGFWVRSTSQASTSMSLPDVLEQAAGAMAGRLPATAGAVIARSNIVVGLLPSNASATEGFTWPTANDVVELETACRQQQLAGGGGNCSLGFMRNISVRLPATGDSRLLFTVYSKATLFRGSTGDLVIAGTGRQHPGAGVTR